MVAKWIFFDLGWTLVDESQAHISRLERVLPFLNKLGIERSTTDLFADCVASATEFAESPYWGVLKKYGLSDDQLNQAKRIAPYAKADEQLYQGVEVLLGELSTKYNLGIIANQSAGTLRRLEIWGIRNYFTLVFASHEAGLSKPDPRIFEAALSKAACEPSEAVMIGDRLDNDIGPANAAGWKTVRVLQGFSHNQVPRNETEIPFHIAENITDISSFL